MRTHRAAIRQRASQADSGASVAVRHIDRGDPRPGQSQFTTLVGALINPLQSERDGVAKSC